MIAPYDLRMRQPGSISGSALRRQAEQLHLVDDPRVMVVAGRAYTEAAREIWPHAIAPLAGVGGLGRQLARLASITHAG